MKNLMIVLAAIVATGANAGSIYSSYEDTLIQPGSASAMEMLVEHGSCYLEALKRARSLSKFPGNLIVSRLWLGDDFIVRIERDSAPTFAVEMTAFSQTAYDRKTRKDNASYAQCEITTIKL